MADRSNPRTSSTAPDESEAGGHLAALATLGALTAFLGGSGFLAARSYFQALNLPEHVSVSWESYIQYGGRFWFTVAMHAIVVAATALGLLAVAVLLGTFRTRWPFASSRLRRAAQRTRAVAANRCVQAGLVVALGMTALASELWLVSYSGVWFEPARVSVRDIPDLAIVAVEASIYIIVWWLYCSRQFWWAAEYRTVARLLCFGVPLLLVLGTLGFFPSLFGRTLMLPSWFDRVTVSRKDAGSMQGLLIFGNDKWIFVSVNGRLVQIRRESVEVVSYDARQQVEKVK